MSELTIDIRCYCHGLGDCLLLKLPKADGTPFWMLFDCGVHSATKEGGDAMRRVVTDVADTIAGEGRKGCLDVLVVTHEHMDHLSGFLQAAETFRSRIEVGEVWFSWAENPRDPDARRLDRFKSDAADALKETSLRLGAAPEFGDTKDGIDAILGFMFGAKGERVREAREAARACSRTVRHLEPGTIAALRDVPGLRAYVLGPPRDAGLLGIEDVLSETYALDIGTPHVAPISNGLRLNAGTLAIDDDPASPFDDCAGLALDALAQGECPGAVAAFFRDHYFGEDAKGGDQTWRRIDHDWLAGTVEMALQLDGRTNNTSLVLAVEIVETGRVLLFAGDAQIGNWMSWSAVRFPATGERGEIGGDDLVRRTVFYKVGHHGSRNATRASAVEMMDSKELVAFNPTDATLAAKLRWKDFPALKTSEALKKATDGRFISSDADWIKAPGLPVPFEIGGALRKIKVDPGGLYVDLTLA